MRTRDRITFVVVLVACMLGATISGGGFTDPWMANDAQAQPAQTCFEGPCPSPTKTPSSPPASLDLDPPTANNDINTQHVVSAIVLNASGQPVSDATVSFRVTGAHSSTGSALSDGFGNATFGYFGTATGTDEIVAWIDDTPNGEPDSTEFQASAVKHWFEPIAECQDFPEAICGTNGDDMIEGTPGDDMIIAGAGDDVILGLEGDDIILAGADDDRAVGGEGADTIYGDANSPPVQPDQHRTLTGATQEFNDKGRDELLGGIGDDFIFGGGGKDKIEGGGGSDFAKGEEAADRIEGGKGRDVVHGDQGDDDVYGEVGDDKVWGDDGDDLLFGGDGDDDLYGLDGIDSCIQGSGDGIARRCESLTKRHR